MTLLIAIVSFIALGGWIYLAFFRGAFWQLALDEGAPLPASWPSIDIIVPARDEAGVLPRSLPTLLQQDYPGPWRVLLVDDRSSDGTADVARRTADSLGYGDRLQVIMAPEPLPGWAGKVAAMQAGVDQSRSTFILFTDADIDHPIDHLTRLASRAVERRFDLVSRMVKLNCSTAAERLLIPAFVFYFSMLYPFRRVNDPDQAIGGAAGGVMLVRREALEHIGGLTAIRGALIDDCALGNAIKSHGGPQETPGHIELLLSTDAYSLRLYPETTDVQRMIARTAYTQLNHSRSLLFATVVMMIVMFFVPVLVPVFGLPLAAEASLAAWFIMSMIYLPMIRFYELHPVRALTLPAAAVFYLLATITSARLFRQGRGGAWKGRTLP